MRSEIIVPAQVRAARALLNWSQEELSRAANVSLTTVRDFEGERRTTDTSAMREIRRAFDNEGVAFVSGGPDGGPGVRFASKRPHIIRQPIMRRFQDLYFGVEWEGREITVSVSFEVMQDLGTITGPAGDATYQKVFADHRGKILDAVTRAIAAGKVSRDQRVLLTAEDFPGLVPLLSLST
jgi:transcriptional regulator with XRE-family HTH domain